MVSNCANPSCGVPLRYLRDGRLYQFEVKALANGSTLANRQTAKKPSRQVWHYWLCGPCSSSMTLEFDQLRGLKLTPIADHMQLAS